MKSFNRISLYFLNTLIILTVFFLSFTGIVNTQAAPVEQEDPQNTLVNTLNSYISTRPDEFGGLLVNSTSIENGTLTVDFNEQLNQILVDDHRLSDLQEVVDALARPQDISTASESSATAIIQEYKYLIDGQGIFNNRLSSFSTQPRPIPTTPAQVKSNQPLITLSPGHGYYQYKDGIWVLQRTYYNGIVEDFTTSTLTANLRSKLAANYAINTARELDKTNPAVGPNNAPLWQQGASQYLKQTGLPASVWNDPGTPVSTDPGLNSDIRSRPLYANYQRSDMLISIHTNGSGVGLPAGCGTETLYDTTNPSRDESKRLAYLIQSKVIATIRANYNPNWCDRGVIGSEGFYAENRIAKMPSVILELAFHDNPSDNQALQDQVFNDLAMSAVNDAVNEFYATQVYEAESLTGVGVLAFDSKASNSITNQCIKCVGSVIQNGFVASNANGELVRFRYHVNADAASFDPATNPNPTLFTVQSSVSENGNTITQDAQTLTWQQYLALPDTDGNGYKEWDFTLAPSQNSYVYQQLISNQQTTFGIDKVEVLTIPKPL